MSGKRYDATTKSLIETQPQDWLRLLGIPIKDVSIKNSGLATVNVDADRVLLIKAEIPWILLIGLQSSYDASLLMRTLQYSVMLTVKHKMPVKSVLVLLRPEENQPDFTGEMLFFTRRSALPHISI